MPQFPSPTTGLIDGAMHRYALRVYYEDTDAGGIVYHANYLRWFERARSDLLELLAIDQQAALTSGLGGYTVAQVSIRYLAPARLGDVVNVETSATRIGGASCVMLQTALRGDTKLAEASVTVGFVGPEGKPRRQPRAWLEAFATIASEAEGQE